MLLKAYLHLIFYMQKLLFIIFKRYFRIFILNYFLLKKLFQSLFE